MWKFSVRKPYTVIVAVAMVLVLGFVSWGKMTTDLLPDINLPYLVVMTSYTGGSPEEVETMVTKPVEQAMATLENISNITSVSSQDQSVVILEFEDDVNMDSITVDTREKLDMLTPYWNDSVGNPMITKISPDMLPIVMTAVDSDEMSREELTRKVNEEILPKIEGVSGVASVTLSGGLEKEVSVALREDKIEDINDQIREEVEAQLDEAEQKLLDAKAQLDEGKTNLEEQMNAFSEGMTETDQGVLSGKLELLKAEIQLSQSSSDLNSKEMEIQMLESVVNSMNQSLSEMRQRVSEQEQSVAAREAEVAQKETDIQTREQELAAQRASLEQQIEELTAQGTRAIGMELKESHAVMAPSQSSGQESGNQNSLSENPTEPSQSAAAADTQPESAAPSQPETSKSPTEPSETEPSSPTEPSVTNPSDPTQPSGTEPVNPTDPVQPSDDGTADELADLQRKLAEVSAEEQKLALEKAACQIEKATVEGERSAFNAASDELARFESQAAATTAQLADAKAALAAAKAQIASGQGTIDGNQEMADEQERELIKQREEAEKKLEEAQEQAKSGEEELEEQIANFPQTREETLAAATIDGKVTKEMIQTLLQAQNFDMPAGYVTQDDTQYLVRVGDAITDPEELKNLILFDPQIEGMDVVALQDVADIEVTDNGEETYAKINGNDGLILSIQKQNTYSTSEVSDAVNEALDSIMETDSDIHFTALMDQGEYIHIVIRSVLENLLMGGILAVLILFLFLKDIKPTFIIACSIPISVIFAIVLMYFSGVTLNIISLSGLAVGVGMLVDNSIVVIENIYRLRNKGYSVMKAAVSGAAQVAGAITSSTLTTVCVFLPIVFVEGLTRQLFVDMALTITYSLMASLVIALTLVPMMASGILKKTKEKKHRLLPWLIRCYDRLIRGALHRRWLVIVVSVVILAVSVVASLSRGTAFMPEADSNQLRVTMEMTDEDADEAQIRNMADQVMERIQSVDHVETVGTIIGDSESLMTGMGDSDRSAVSIYVVLDEEKGNSRDAEKEIEEACADLEGCEVTADGSSVDMSALGGSGISVQISGQEIDQLSAIAEDVAAIVEGTEGTAEVTDGITDPTPELCIRLDKEKAMKEGLTVAQVYQELREKLAPSGSATTITSDDGEEYSTFVMNETEQMTPDDIRNYVFTVNAADGSEKEVNLSDIATVEETQTLSEISRDGQKRVLTVTAQIAEGYNIGLVSRDLEERLRDYQVPEGYAVTMEGENEMINEALDQLILMGVLGIVLIYCIMVAQFQSFRSPFIVMFTIPLAFTGGFLALFLTGQEVSVVAMVGFIMLAGVVVNNGIVLVDYINQLRLEGMDKREAIIEAGKTRMRPILMTAITTILGLFTMALGIGTGSSMMQPVAIVTIGGLTYATIMTLFVVPVMYDLFAKKHMKAVDENELEIVDD